MKIQKILIVLVLLSFNSMVYAHCPATYAPEKACFMFNQDKVYIYDHKVEHNGPYKDFKNAEVSAFKRANGPELSFKKLARGIYQIEAAEKLNEIVMVVTANKKKNEIRIKNE